jgi:hypothetical protein
MSKQDVRKLLDKQIGSQGLKISTRLSDGYRPSTKTVVSGSLKLSFPDAWDSRIGVNIAKKLGLIASSIDLNQLIAEHITSLRWWGESYSYFNRKSDAVAFAEEYEYLIREQIFIPGIKQWQAAVPGHTPLPGWFIDPETLEPKQTQTTTRPLVVEHLSHISGIKTNGELSLPVSSAAALGMLDLEKYLSLSPSLRLVAARTIAIALNISLLMTSYPDLKTAASSQESRPLLILVHQFNQDAMLGLKFGLKLTSAEIASVHKRNIPNLNFPFSAAEMTELVSDLDRNDQRYLEYFTELFNQAGVYNNLLIAPSEGTPMQELWEAVEIAPDSKLKPESKPFARTPEPVVEIPATVVVEVEQAPAVTAQESQPVIVTPSNPQPEASQRQLGENLTDYQASITHRFDYNGGKCAITLVTNHEAVPVGIIISGHKLDFTTLSYLSTVSELASLALLNGASLGEVGQLLKGVVAGQSSSEYSSILDYCGNWLASYR